MAGDMLISHERAARGAGIVTDRPPWSGHSDQEKQGRIPSWQATGHCTDSRLLADPFTWQGTNLLAARRWKEAVAALRNAFELRKKGAEDPALVALNQFLLAQATWGAGDRAEATTKCRTHKSRASHSGPARLV